MKILTIRVVQIVALISTLSTRQALGLSQTGQFLANISYLPEHLQAGGIAGVKMVTNRT